MYKAVWTLAQMAYRVVLRDLLQAAIDDPDQEWDNIVLDICDKIFGYEV